MSKQNPQANVSVSRSMAYNYLLMRKAYIRVHNSSY